tara:strand:- start:10743 stop:12422 length:1680 start_codon:yes stop_codon:yes gene_type:complete
MPSPLVFANTAPPQGEIRILYTNPVGSPAIVRALTISNVDKNGNVSTPSLEELNAITLSVLAGTEATHTFLIESINKKNGYFYIDLVDQTFTSGSLGTTETGSVILDPYLITNFDNNDSNAVFSNATEFRNSNFHKDIDRGGGQVRPLNYNAIAGIDEVVLGDVKLIHNSLPFEYPITKDYPEYTYTGSFNGFSNTVNINNAGELDIIVTDAEIVALLGTNPPSAFIFPEGTFSLQGAIFHGKTDIILEVDDSIAFDNANSNRFSQVIHTQEYSSSLITQRSIPSRVKYTAGLATADTLYLRVKQIQTISSVVNNTASFTLNSLFKDSNTQEDFLRVSVHRENPIPYADKAPIQDSSYTDTGLTNARYNGTKTTSVDYSGIEPAISAGIFKAAAYPLLDDNNFICSQSLSDRVVEEFYFEEATLTTSIPDARIGTISAINTLQDATDTGFELEPEFGTGQSAGDILLIGTEQIKILGLVYNIQTNKPVLFVKRGENSTTAVAHPAGTVVYRTRGSKIFKLNGNKVVGLGAQKLWIQDDRSIVETSDSGYILQVSTTCTV